MTSYIKESREFKLDLVFKDDLNFRKAIKFLENESYFSLDDTNKEFNTISFMCSSQSDCNSLERQIEKELIVNDIEGYYFEAQ